MDEPVIDISGNDVTDMVEQAAPKPRVKRAPSAYNNFVKETYSTLSDIPKNERFTKCAQMWKEHKENLANPKKEPAKKKAVRKKKPVKK